MKLNPQQAPLYGECLLTVQLCDEERLDDDEDVEFYLLFSGTTQRHLTSTLRISHVTLQAICPAHDCCESVQVTLCSAKPGQSVDTLAEEHFQFVQDLAFDMAQFLVSTAGQDDGLEGALLLDECRIPLQECERLDESLALALRHLTLPDGWSVLGTKLATDTIPAPQETLLHFAARRGLRRVAVFLLQQPGGREALRIPNKQGVTPACVAENKGHYHVQQLLTPEETIPWTGPEALLKLLDGRVVRHHPRLNTYTLTTTSGPPPSLQSDVDELRRLIRCHAGSKGVSSSWTPQECGSRLGTVTEESGLEQLERDSLLDTKQKSEEDQAECIVELSPAASCGTEAGPDHGPDDGKVGESARQCQNSGGEESGVGHVAIPVGDSEKASDKSDTVQSREKPASSVPSCGKWQEEADTARGVISAAQANAEGLDNGSQEEEKRGEERAAETTAQADGDCPAGAGMGHAQSNEQPDGVDSETDTEGTEHAQEEEQDAEKAKGALSNGGGEGETERMRTLSGPALEQSEPEDGEAGPERPPPPTIDLTPCQAEPEPAANSSESSQETAVIGDSEESGGRTPEPEQSDFGECLTVPEVEAANLGDGAHGSAESVCSAGGEPLLSESTEESFTREGEEGSFVDGDTPASDTVTQAGPGPQPSAEPANTTENHTHLAEEREGSDSRAPENQAAEAPPTQNDITSPPCVSHKVDSSIGEMVRGGDVRSGGLPPSSEEDRFLFISDFAAPSVHLPAVSWETQATQEVSSPAQEETTTPSQTDQTCTHLDPLASLSESTGEARLEEEEGGESVTSSGAEPDPCSSPNEDATEAAYRGSSLGSLTGAPDSNGPPGAASGQNECLGESVESHLKQDGSLGSEITEPEPATPSNAQGGEIHRDTTPPDMHTKEKEEERAKEVECHNQSTHCGPEVPDSRATTEVASVTGGDSEPESLPAVVEQSGEDSPEQTVDRPSLKAEVKEGSECTDSKLSADEIIAPCVLHGNSETTVPEMNHETADLESLATPVTCGLVTPYMAGDTSLTDPAHDSSPGLERVEEESEETEESTTESGEVLRTTKVEEDPVGLPAVDVVDGRRESAPGEEADRDSIEIHRDKDTFLSIDPCGEQTPEKKRSSVCPESPLSPTPGSSISTTHRESGSDADGLFSPVAGEDSVFRKVEEPVPRDSTSESCSSTDDTASVGPPSSTPDSCVGGGRRWSSEDARQPGATGGGEAEEEKDRLTEVPVRTAILRSSIRSLSPFRRHSWGPGKNPGGEAEMNQRSSLRSLGDGKPTLHRRSMSWCPSEVPPSPDPDEISSRSYSLEGLSADRDGGKDSPLQGASPREPYRLPRQESEERGSLVSLTEEEHESDLGECSSLDSQKSGGLRPARHSCQSMTLPLTKSVSLLSISQKEVDAMGRPRPKRRISFSFSISPILPKSKTVFSIGSSSSDEEESCSMRSFSSASGSLGYSISEEDPGPLRSDSEGKGGTKVSRTFSYLKSKMYKKTKEKDKDRSRDKEKEAKEREKRTLNGHLFSALNSGLLLQCYQCNKAINTKDALYCTNCNAQVHKGCKEILPVCAKVKMKHQKQQHVVTDSATMPPVTLRSKTTPARERPWSAISAPDDPALVTGPRRHTSMMTFNSSNLSKSISISNIAGPVFDEMPLKGLRYLSQSTDSLHKTSKVNESTESLTDEGTEMMDSQLMGEFEAEAKELEADSWSFTQDKKYLKQLKKDIIKRQDVIYELIQTEMHHVRTLKIMADVYSKGLQKEVQLEAQTVERVFPVLEELLDLHTAFFSRALERKREAQLEGKEGGFVIRTIGDILVTQFSGSNAERMKKVYGKFCSRHNEAVNFYKELHTKDKRFQAFIKKKMSSTIVRRLGIPECILLVTQRITKYPVLLQRILQHTKENEEDHRDVAQALRLVKEVIVSVDSKVNEHEKKRRLKEVYSRTDSKSIMRMKSGQMFAREDLVRGRRLLHDGTLQLKNSTGRLKEVQALLLSDIFVFLQEKDQKYVFASLDQRSTVISLQKLIVREVANEEKGLFLITAGIEKPEMVEVHASSKEERNTWMQLIQEAMHSMEKDEDEGIPSETEEDKRLLETKAKEMRDLLRKKDEQIVALLEEKVKLFRDMCDCGTPEEPGPGARMLFRATADNMPKGEPVMKDALKEVETLQTLVNGSLGGAVGQLESAGGGGVGPVCLPRRAETFGGFDSHQMNISKNGEKDEGEDAADLRRTESDSVLKKGGNANLLLLLKRNSEQVLHSVTHLHDLLNTLQAVVVQQDSFIEDQRQALSERPASRPSSRPSSLIEQEKQRSLEKQRQEAANLQRQQAAHAEERRRREREWEGREQALGDREALLNMQEEEAQRRRKDLEAERQELQSRKDEYQKDLERLRDAQRKLERDKEQVRRELERVEQMRLVEEKKMYRTPSTTSEDSLLFQSSGSLDREAGECELSSSPRKDSMSRGDSKRKGKNLLPFASSPTQKAPGGDAMNQIPNRLMQLAKAKDKKEKKKKKGKGQHPQPAESPHLPVSDQPLDGEIFFC